jgi:DNA-binding transcriptional regulator YdaS (Cro superfamily)
MSTPLKAVFDAAGGQSALAKELGIKPQAVQQWKKVPPKYVLRVEGLTGYSRYDLRPDVYGEAPAQEQAA